ncbi:hypothetical protein MSG28_001929 [Choristoneura fumiferana]|uniref:Uncharacterized protein n=1 Tax=Choristoneura fumiferana TaxID=7141 RepID=A0ACC0JTE4_CHOFU|nr:hypothetical protein MSG28_001929 [Choristoneura fumiferana]
MRWCTPVITALVITSVIDLITASARRCAGRLARERLKAAEKIRDKRYFLLCCAPACAPRRPKTRPPASSTKYQPYHKTWFGLKYVVV